MAIVIDSIDILNFDFDNFLIIVKATSDDPPLEYSLDNQNFQITNTFVVPNDQQSSWTIYLRDNALNTNNQQIFGDLCVVESNKNNFVRWRPYTNLIVDNGEIINAVCPGPDDVPSDPPWNNLPTLNLHAHCIVVP